MVVVTTIKELFGMHYKQEMENYVAKGVHIVRSMVTFLLWHYYLNKRNSKVVY